MIDCMDGHSHFLGHLFQTQAIQVMKRLGLSREELSQQVLRAIFNVVGRNQDDHVKNIAFLMNRKGEWRLSPAFDVTYAWDPKGNWTSQHQMSINGKRERFERADLVGLAATAGIKKTRAHEMVDRVLETVRKWPDFAGHAGVLDTQVERIQKSQRINL